MSESFKAEILAMVVDYSRRDSLTCFFGRAIRPHVSSHHQHSHTKTLITLGVMSSPELHTGNQGDDAAQRVDTEE